MVEAPMALRSLVDGSNRAPNPLTNIAARRNDDIRRDVARDLVSVIIVNFNAGDYLQRTVESVRTQGHQAFEIIVVDNHSTDDSADWYRTVAETDDDLHFLPLDTNTGFAHACNRGIHMASGHYLLFLNPDCRLMPGAMTQLLEVMQSDPDVGMVGPQVVNPDGTQQRGSRRDIPTPWQIFCVTLQLHRLMPQHPRFRGFNRHEEPLPTAPLQVNAVSGACMLVRRDAVSTVGTMDSDFFLHFEDLDWCLRFNNADEKIMFSPAAIVEHTRGVCSAKRPIRAEYHKHRSLIRFLRKHFTAYYPSSFMALVAVMVSIRFVLLMPRLIWHGLRKTNQRSIGDLPI